MRQLLVNAMHESNVFFSKNQAEHSINSAGKVKKF
jgi:hypothetical protein